MHNKVERKDYIKFLLKNPELNPMPKRFRQDLDPLPNEIIAEPTPPKFEEKFETN